MNLALHRRGQRQPVALAVASGNQPEALDERPEASAFEGPFNPLGFTFSFGGFGLNYHVVRPVREKALGILRRLDRDAELDRRKEKKAGYAPIPHHRFGNAFRPLQNGRNYRTFIEQVRDRFFTQPGQSFWLRGLFWSIASIDATALGVIDELLDRHDAESIRIALQLIEGAPPEFALSQPDFAVQAIEKCGRVDTKLGELAESVLLVNSQTGSFNRAPGQPSPRYVSLKERSEAFRDRFAAGSRGNRLFTRMRDIALEMLNRERLDDEQMRFE